MTQQAQFPIPPPYPHTPLSLRMPINSSYQSFLPQQHQQPQHHQRVPIRPPINYPTSTTTTANTSTANNNKHFRSAGPSLPLVCPSPQTNSLHPTPATINYSSSHSQPRPPAIELSTPNQSPSPSLPVRPPPMNKIAEFAAQMMCYLWFAEPSTLRRTQAFYQHQQQQQSPPPTSSSYSDASSPTTTASTTSSSSASASVAASSSTAATSATHLSTNNPSPLSITITQAQLVPNPEFVMFIHNLLNTTQVSHSVVLLALFYIHRLKCLNAIKPNSKSEYRIGVVSLMLANKMLDDHTYTAKTWSEVSRLPLGSLNDGEIEFLRGLHFELHVNIRDFSAWFKLLHGMVHLKDRHTAIALASGPRTRWFKKMRVASAEGLTVLEGLVSPIRNSKLMKVEAEKEKKCRAAAALPREILDIPPSRFHAPSALQAQQQQQQQRQQQQQQRQQQQQPTHPYNLRRSARGLVVSSTHTTPIQQFPRWDGSPSSVSSAYSAIIPPNALSMTPQQQLEFRERQIASLPPKSRTTQYSSSGYPTRLNTSGKRNVDEYLSSQEQLEESMNELNRHKRMSSISTSVSSSTRVPTTLHTPSSQQLLSQLAPMISLQDANGAYLGTAIVPTTTTTTHNGGRAELCFRSITAGRRGGQDEVVRQEVPSGTVYMFGSEPWKRGTPMEDGGIQEADRGAGGGGQGKGGNWFYSNFSNAGLPGVVWADGSSLPPHTHHPSNNNPHGAAEFYIHTSAPGSANRLPPLALSPPQSLHPSSSSQAHSQLVDPARLQHLHHHLHSHQHQQQQQHSHHQQHRY
ncbi:hypothetical protein Pst134EA_013575 [Puccinia striiformis f. sp. tritici]|uniref:hypothetical protein n=2 Tax=Puccinia striiformis f. sp. tritici TaxID=168172 RepID=UPI00200836F7|nr:hypothetical protein Pst134EA_013575 [Puccinia striiformis f. sp. tritici]KAH9465704.1 hypothetical protein Pst134EA_013575 [Puccinia striiformis f. sp. tritici]